MTDKLDAFLDALDERLGSYAPKGTFVSGFNLRDMIRESRAKLAEEPTPEAGWSEWLVNGGVRCPLPENTLVDWDNEPTQPMRAGYWDWMGRHGHRFRYREGAPGGWVARPKGWVPPESLWDEASPVRCEWAYGSPDNPRIAHLGDEDWKNVTYIRLLPRNAASEPAPELPEWVEVECDRYRIMLPAGCIVYLDLESVGRIGELRDILAARRRAGL